jgi:hypothetical protein
MLKALIKDTASRLGYDIRKSPPGYADPQTLEKADTFVERFREVVSDPLNLLIERVPEAGYVDAKGCVILHNGHKVPVRGPHAYYADFSDVLIINRGVHEPLEEFCFQTMMSRIRNDAPTMLELGAYWAHYSMWLMKHRPGARCFMVEPDVQNLACGRNNFSINGYRGEFINDIVGTTGFQVDAFISSRGITHVEVLHSDIQGYEMEMLKGARKFLSAQSANYVFISTHSEALHTAVVQRLREYSYRVEVSSGVETHTTSCDGFVLATSPNVEPLFGSFSPLGRLEIAQSSSRQLLDSLVAVRI